MIRELLLWPIGKEVEAMNYADLADAAYANLTGNPADVWCYRDRFDRYGRQVTPYFGPTGGEWDGEPIPEPANCLAARGDATLVDHVEWLEEEYDD